MHVCAGQGEEITDLQISKLKSFFFYLKVLLKSFFIFFLNFKFRKYRFQREIKECTKS